MLIILDRTINYEQNPPNPTNHSYGRLLVGRMGFVCLRQAAPTRLLVLSRIDRINPPLQLAMLDRSG